MNKCNYAEYSKAAKEFFDRLPGSNVPEAENGFKCLVLMYFSLEGDEREVYEAMMVVKIASRKMLEGGFATRLTPPHDDTYVWGDADHYARYAALVIDDAITQKDKIRKIAPDKLQQELVNLEVDLNRARFAISMFQRQQPLI